MYRLWSSPQHQKRGKTKQNFLTTTKTSCEPLESLVVLCISSCVRKGLLNLVFNQPEPQSKTHLIRGKSVTQSSVIMRNCWSLIWKVLVILSLLSLVINSHLFNLQNCFPGPPNEIFTRWRIFCHCWKGKF